LDERIIRTEAKSIDDLRVKIALQGEELGAGTGLVIYPGQDRWSEQTLLILGIMQDAERMLLLGELA
jgi:hypothetical protein